MTLDSNVSLREAITSINNQADLNADVTHTGTYGTNDTIRFIIAGGDTQTITVLGSASLALARTMTIDGTTQPGWPTTVGQFTFTVTATDHYDLSPPSSAHPFAVMRRLHHYGGAPSREGRR